MLRLVQEGVVEAIDGSLTRVQADSICVHGDSPGAVDMARALRTQLEQAGVSIRAFAAAAPRQSA
ncbi:LamB/YcsF family protein [compost metagenome]